MCTPESGCVYLNAVYGCVDMNLVCVYYLCRWLPGMCILHESRMCILPVPLAAAACCCVLSNIYHIQHMYAHIYIYVLLHVPQAAAAAAAPSA